MNVLTKADRSLNGPQRLIVDYIHPSGNPYDPTMSVMEAFKRRKKPQDFEYVPLGIAVREELGPPDAKKKKKAVPQKLSDIKAVKRARMPTFVSNMIERAKIHNQQLRILGADWSKRLTIGRVCNLMIIAGRVILTRLQGLCGKTDQQLNKWKVLVAEHLGEALDGTVDVDFNNNTLPLQYEIGNKARGMRCVACGIRNDRRK
eukprot:Seg4607.3 transcript_id=Seg4607.3/GoldUCD/mRNA.D3Y31 product="hypothetical protein" protein_id=Seg4607.3/GoldUCD/D3Y31